MVTTIDKLTLDGCSTDDRHKVCRSRGGESCAFDGAMIVLQPIADTAHLVHGPIACCGNSWEGRGTLSSKGELHTRGFTTDMREIDIVYGAEEKLLQAIRKTRAAVLPKAIFVYATCVSGLIGEDLDAVCKRAEKELGIPVIPVNAPGFVGPKNLGNRIAGEVLLEHVIGTGEAPVRTHADINLIGEYNIAGDLWLLEPLLRRAGIRVLSRITGDASFEEISWAHQAKLNVVVCGRALINVAKAMERKYGIPYVEVSFFGSTETAKALRAIGEGLERVSRSAGMDGLNDIDGLIRTEEDRVRERLRQFEHLRGKKAVLYTGGVKSWSFISALGDLGIEVVAVGTKKSTVEDEQRMRELLGPDAPLVEDVAPKKLVKLLKERGADILIAGGRNQYLAIKEGYPFVDVNQERHTAYAGYEGLVNLAEKISNSLQFYRGSVEPGLQPSGRGQNPSGARGKPAPWHPPTPVEGGSTGPGQALKDMPSSLLLDPLKHSPALGAAMAFQGVHRALPVLHGAQGCSFLGKVLLTKHFREPIALATSKIFVESVVMGSEESLARAVQGAIEKDRLDVIGIITSGLTEVKGDDAAAVARSLEAEARGRSGTGIVHVPAPDYDGGLETGYARAVEAILGIAERSRQSAAPRQINVLAGAHLTPADATELRETIRSFCLEPVILPDLSALDGSRQGISALALGGTTVESIRTMGDSLFTLVIGMSLVPAADLLHRHFGVGYQVFDGVTGMAGTDALLAELSRISGRPMPGRLHRQRLVLADGMRDAHEYFGGKKICLALEPDLAVQTSRWLTEMGATVDLAIVPTLSPAADRITARDVRIGGLSLIQGKFDAVIANSHAERTAGRIDAPLYEIGFPVYKSLGYTSKVTMGYRGTLTIINEVGSVLMKGH
jgi:nitrogenase molybdenum-cofactor synthesis protein NifE